KQAQEAAEAFERVLSLRENEPEAIFGLAELYYGPLGDLERAKEYFLQYIGMGELPRKEMAEQRVQVIDMRIEAGLDAQQAEPEQRESRGASGLPDDVNLDFLPEDSEDYDDEFSDDFDEDGSYDDFDDADGGAEFDDDADDVEVDEEEVQE